jgi:hypothetical protein
MNAPYRDTPIEKRVSDLRFIRRPEEAEELSFLEEYLRWKNDGGPEKLVAAQAAQRQKAIQEEYKAKRKGVGL